MILKRQVVNAQVLIGSSSKENITSIIFSL